MTLNVLVPHPHIKEHHLKHTAGLLTVSGTALELMHSIPYAGIIMLCAGGLIAIYEPYVMKTFSIILPDEEEPKENTI